MAGTGGASGGFLLADFQGFLAFQGRIFSVSSNPISRLKSAGPENLIPYISMSYMCIWMSGLIVKLDKRWGQGATIVEMIAVIILTYTKLTFRIKQPEIKEGFEL